MPFEPGHKKLAGRQKGTPNKASSIVLDILTSNNMNIAQEAIGLYHQAVDPEFKLRVLSLLFPYCYHKKIDAGVDDSLDVTPENELEIANETLKAIYQKFPQLNPGKDE